MLDLSIDVNPRDFPTWGRNKIRVNCRACQMWAFGNFWVIRGGKLLKGRAS
jgi:hypothetical protein